MKAQINNRIYGLDILRSAAIILVFMYHYMVFVSHQPTFGFLSNIGWVGVDLFFTLSGYLIGHQLFSPIARQREFSYKFFYYRRLLRTLPNYLFILGIYFFIPAFRERPELPPLWKFLTFTQNLGLKPGTAFSHAWSLCIEEQFYLMLPVLAFLIAYKKSVRVAWAVISGMIIAGIILRCSIWIYYPQHTGNDFELFYYTNIYYSSFCRFDELILGVSVALLRNFHQDIWLKVIAKGNLILLLGVIGSGITCYLFLQYQYSLMMAVLGYPCLAVCFAALTVAAISPGSYLHHLKIPGATTLAIWSYAIYLLHKPLSVIIYSELSRWGIKASGCLAVLVSAFVIVSAGGLLYICVEKPFLKLREKIDRQNREQVENQQKMVV